MRSVHDRPLGGRAADVEPDHRNHSVIMTPAMQIIPVLDLRAGIVVRARRGERSEYVPLRSSLVQGCEPVAVARELCAICRTRTVYVADLDARGGNPVDEATLAGLASVATTWVDASATTPQRAAALARVGVARNVVSTQSIGPEALPGGLFAMSAPPLVLSVDLRDGRLISPDLASSGPTAAAPLARVLDVRELLVIDLARAGAGSGPALEAVAELVAALPDVAIYPGGGVRDQADLRALESAGAAGALVATALHDGRLTP